MKKVVMKLPGARWRALSFIPQLNWISTLNLGIVSSSPINIVAAMLYGALIFMIGQSDQPFYLDFYLYFLIWLIGIVHYAVAYRIVKKRVLAALKEAPPAAKTTRIARDITENPRFEDFFSFTRKRYSYKGPPAPYTPFAAYWPTYDSMNRDQRAWYFFWRSQARKGVYTDTDLSYIFIYIYELLCLDNKPCRVYDSLTKIWVAYRYIFPELDRYMSEWTLDFALFNDLVYSPPLNDDLTLPASSLVTDVLVKQREADAPLKLPFALFRALCDYPVVNSKFYKNGAQDLIKEALPRVVALADASLRKKTGKGVLATYGPAGAEARVRYLFRGAVCPLANEEFSAMVEPYSATPALRAYINELARCGENVLRGLRNFRGRLRGATLDGGTASLVEAFLKKQYGQTAPHADEDGEPEVKTLLTDAQEVAAIYAAVSSKARVYLDSLKESGWERAAAPEDEETVAEINRLAERYLCRALLAREKSADAGAAFFGAAYFGATNFGATNFGAAYFGAAYVVVVEDDYRDELEYVIENPPELTADGGAVGLFDLSVLEPDLAAFVESLLPEQQKALLSLLRSDDPLCELDRIADEALTAPQIIIDDMNGAALRTLGDLIVSSNDEALRVADEYATALELSIRVGANSKKELISADLKNYFTCTVH